jgi:hypothetical protein
VQELPLAWVGRIALTAAIAASLAGEAQAGMVNGSCAHPEIFSEADVNVVVLPFEDQTGGAPSDPDQHLTLLLQQEVLALIAPLGSVGTVRLVNDFGPCTIDAVRSKLQPRPGQSLIFVSGYLFVDGPNINLQTVVTIDRGPEGLPAFELSVENATFHAPLPGRPIVFTPRRISSEDLAQIDALFGRFARLYERPDEASPSRPIPVSQRDRQAVYSVVDERGQWMQVDASFGRGWLRAGDLIDGGRLAQILPELLFVKAAAGFLRSLTRGARIDSDRTSARALFEDAVDALDGAAAADADEQPRAWTAAARILTVLATDKGPAALDRAASIAQAAVSVAPEDPTLRVMRAALRLGAAHAARVSGIVATWRLAERDLLLARVLGAEKWQGVSNLQLLATLDLSPGQQEADQLALADEKARLYARLDPPSPPPPPEAVAAAAAEDRPGSVQLQVSSGLAVCCNRVSGSLAADFAILRQVFSMSIGFHAVLGDPRVFMVPVGISREFHLARLSSLAEASVVAGLRAGAAWAQSDGQSQAAVFVTPEIGIKIAFAGRFFVATPLALPLLLGFRHGGAAIFQPQVRLGVGL